MCIAVKKELETVGQPRLHSRYHNLLDAMSQPSRLLPRWSGVRVVEGAALEMLYTGNCIVGSNPTHSAV